MVGRDGERCRAPAAVKNYEEGAETSGGDCRHRGDERQWRSVQGGVETVGVGWGGAATTVWGFGQAGVRTVGAPNPDFTIARTEAKSWATTNVMGPVPT